MDKKLNPKDIKPYSGRLHKKNKKNKPWWHQGLSALWSELCRAEKDWVKSKPQDKQKKRSVMKVIQKQFQREVQSAKRRHWYSEQEALLAACEEDQASFWKKIGQVGIAKDRSIPMAVYNDEGQITREIETVLNKWKDHFKGLLNVDNQPTEVDPADLPQYPQPRDVDQLNQPITPAEVWKALRKAKLRKAIGVDLLPVEVLRNPVCATFLVTLYNICFRLGKMPTVWNKSVITPVHKDKNSDIYIPTNYRGISITSSVYKIYCSVINDRLTCWVENNNILEEEQNGFRKGRSTVDHLVSFSNIIESRKLRKLNTFVAFIDFSAAYDRINRNFLWKKMECLGLNGNILNAVKSLYSNVECCVKLGNGNFTTDWFNVNSGLRQGCLVSPQLFNIYINDLAKIIKQECNGIRLYGDKKVCLMMYADDIVFMSESEEELQEMLSVLERWCKTWEVSVNVKKSQIMHFRKKQDKETDFDFKFNGHSMDKVGQYKYLGLMFDCFLDFKTTAKCVAKSANRALGLLIAKVKSLGGVSYKCYTKLYESMVMSIIRYGAAVWGHREYSEINAVHNRMCRYFLGVNKYSPNVAIQGDMGTRVPWQHQWLEIARQWCRICDMSDDRLNKQVYTWSLGVRGKNWFRRLNSILHECNMQQYLYDVNIDKKSFLKDFSEQLENMYVKKWSKDLHRVGAKSGKGKNKLRTYNTFKEYFASDCYVYTTMPRSHRSAMAQLRCGSAPLRIETGRYENIPVENRLCPLCKAGIEDEMHVILDCPKYDVIRRDLFDRLLADDVGVLCYSKEELLKLVLDCKNDSLVKVCARACHDILMSRRKLLYQS